MPVFMAVPLPVVRVCRRGRSTPPSMGLSATGGRPDMKFVGFFSIADTVGEFPSSAVWPEDGGYGARRGGESGAPDARPEFADSIHCYPRPKGASAGRPDRTRPPIG